MTGMNIFKAWGRALLRCLLWLPIWLIGLVLVVMGLALSPWGTGLLLEQGQSRGFLTYQDASGAPLDHLVIDGLALEAGPASIYVERLELDWADDCLLDSKLCLDRLGVTGARIRLAASEAGEPDQPTSESGAAPTINVPFPIELRDILLDDVDVRLADGTHLRWSHFQTGASLDAGTLTLSPTTLSGMRLTLPTSEGQALALDNADRAPSSLSAQAIDSAGQVARQTPPVVSDAAEASEPTVPLAQRERIALPAITLPLAIEVPNLVIEDAALTGPNAYRVDRLALSLSGQGSDIEISPLTLAMPEADARLEAKITLQDDYPLEARLNAQVKQLAAMPALAGERLDLRLDGNLAALKVALAAKGPATAQLNASLDALAPTLPFELKLESNALQWPLSGASPGADTPSGAGNRVEPYRLTDLRARLNGSLLDYRLALSAEASGPEVAPTRVAATGTGDAEHFAWLPLSLKSGEGALISRGKINWADGLTLDATINLDELDPGAYTSAVAGRLDGDATLSFVQADDGWRLGIPELAIDGTLNDLPVSLSGSLSGNSDMRWNIKQLDLRQGENRLTAEGQIGDQMDLSGSLQAPGLNALSPELGGTLQGDFQLGGSLDTPTLALDLNGERLVFAENRLGALNLRARTQGLEDPELDLTLEAERLDAGGQRFSRLTLGLDGRLSEHRLTLEATAGRGMPLSRAGLTLEGGLNADRDRYQGQLMPLEVDADAGTLRLDEALTFDVDIAKSAVSLSPFCLAREEGGRLCSTQPIDASAQQGQARLQLTELPMALLEPSLPVGWKASGDNNAEVVVAWQDQGSTWSLDANLDSRLDIEAQNSFGQPVTLPTTQLKLTANATPQAANAELDLELEQGGSVNLTLRIDDPQGQGALDGRLRLQSLQLSPYQPLAGDMETLEGSLNGDIAVGGTLALPTLTGNLTLDSLQAKGSGIPLEVRDGELTVRLRGDSGQIEGVIRSERGRLDIQGDARWPSLDEWELSMSLDGQEEPLQLDIADIGRLRIAPDIQVDVRPERLSVRGQVKVPWARLEIGQIPPSATSPSPDEVIITRRDERRARREATRAEQAGTGEDTAEALASAGMATSIQVELVLGPDMNLKAYGLETGLDGRLQVRQSSGPVQLFGEVSLVGGRFRAYGQDLRIRQGQLLFSGAADQPLLQFEAIRSPDKTQDGVIAGLRVSGSATSPSLSVFSEPAMEESRALSYLLRGRAPNDTESDSSALTSALIGLSLSRTGGAVGQVGEVFGIGDLALDTAGSGDESEVVVSGQLSDDLRVSYGVGVFEPIAELTLRYTLWRNLYIQAVSGAAQAVDLVYSFSLGKADAGQ
ncbi:autotransporter secretion inner membrane protein TamB [Onishia taeanensis]|uniref:Autotransporter secretion inner membrane protein TamB n=1 Tax=Onishia taeanensis TaxID=284577 RepID=A0A1G7QCP2_9GAMM|nr:translocation/assembly module TamB domain-containing protein [Halomonas taeanensis]SDF96282.1 autotransporter secretion inner membrane protein TamB [Halomonas taeanensis]